MTEVAPAANGGELAAPAKTTDAPAKATENTGEKTEPIAAAVTEETEKKLTVVDESASSPTKTSPTHRLKNIWNKTWKKMSSLNRASTTPVGKPTSSDADKGEVTEHAKEEEVKSGEKKKEGSEAATREALEEGKEKVEEEEKREGEDKAKVEKSGEQAEEVKEGAEEEDRKNFWGTVRKWFAQFRKRPGAAAMARASSSEAKREAITSEEKDQVAKADEAKEEAIQPSKVEGSEDCKENFEVAEKAKEEIETKVGSKEAVVEEVPGQQEGSNTIWSRTRKAFAHFRRKSNVVAAGETSKAGAQKEGVFLEGEANGKNPQEQPKEDAKEELKAKEAKSSDVVTAPREGLKAEEANDSIGATGSKEKGEEPLVKSVKKDEKAEDVRQGDSKDTLEKEVEKQSAAVAKDKAPLRKEDGNAKTAEEPVKKEAAVTETKVSESKETSNEEEQKPAAKPVQEEMKSVDLKQQEPDQAPKKEEPKSTEEPVKDEAKVETIKGTE